MSVDFLRLSPAQDALAARRCRAGAPRLADGELRQHLSGRSDHSATLWKLLMLDTFLRSTQQPRALAEPRPTEHEALAMGGVQS